MSDQAGLEDSAVSKGLILAVPTASLEELWALASVDSPPPIDDSNWAEFASISLPEGAMHQVGGITAEIGNGWFTLGPIDGGEYLVCYVRIGHKYPVIPDGPHTTSGCGLIELEAQERIEARLVEGGFHVRPSD